LTLLKLAELFLGIILFFRLLLFDSIHGVLVLLFLGLDGGGELGDLVILILLLFLLYLVDFFSILFLVFHFLLL